MKQIAIAVIGGFRAESVQMRRSKLLLFLATVQSVIFIFLVSIFGLTGSRAPIAIVDEDRGFYSAIFTDSLNNAHHSFSLKFMEKEKALDAVKHGDLVSVIKIPAGFSSGIEAGRNVFIDVMVDNIDVDMTEDIQRAVPSAIVNFARKAGLPGIRVKVNETDMIGHDTGFIPYLVVSALALAAFVVSGILSAAALSHEFESGTIKLLEIAPVNPLAPISGRIAASALYSLAVLLISLSVVIFFYGIIPLHPLELAAAVVMCVIIFSCAGALLGAFLKRTLPAASLVFGLALPLYIDSGAMEPERFDGNAIWAIAHLSPLYYAVGILEHAFHGFQVTPEPVFINFIALFIWAAVLLIFTAGVLKARMASC
ncbi:MAG: ABC transporter permease [Brevinematales bacterium]|jgi:ABC-type multidrug transport system permease subunit